ncbi:MAG: phospholipid carrier-dependent glycosyltransferase [Butyrivibrio sp.]|nr:phospholipid carrier-dependent glycosyltransferase [Acetatifactor muris]MCM1558159.1 phospholipid carrier-dependent glycosyltransferase [Butyrivibrio sp.]
MLTIHLTAALGALLFGACYLLRNSTKKSEIAAPALLFLLAFFLRLTAAGFFHGFDNDTACFAAWADRMFQVGPLHFYSDAVFTDYPPGYMYLLYPVGALRALFGLEYGSPGHLILLKLPAVFCDLGGGLLLYREAARRLDGLKPLVLTAAYLFNPAVILNSSVWGQVDSVYTLLLILMCLNLLRGRMLPAYVSFGLGILIKPQMLLFAPVLFTGVLRQVFFGGFSVKKLLRCLGQGILSLPAALLPALPFGLGNVLAQYLDTVSSCPYAAVNAYNFWGMLGLNWVSQDNTFLGLPYRFYGWAAIGIALILVLFLGLGRRKAGSHPAANYPLLAALFMASVFVFSVRMHERYLYPAVVLLLFACLYLPSKRLYLIYGGFSLLHFYNTAHVLFFYDPYAYDRKDPLILLVSGGTVLLLLLLWITVLRTGVFYSESEPGLQAASAARPESDYLYAKADLSLPPSASRPFLRLRGRDYAWILAITLLYSCFALYDLGDRQAPSTALNLTEGESIVLEFQPEAGQQLKSLAYYIAPGHKRTFSLAVGNGEQPAAKDPLTGSGWEDVGEITLNNVFTWQTAELPDAARGNDCIRLTLESRNASLLELVFLDEAGNSMTPANAGAYPALFDEQALYPAEITFRNGMYFDEIYHARTAYEFLHGLTAYENTHPPLGKLFIAAGVAVFGMTPFGWRIAGTLFGIAMVPIVYLFARRLTESTALAALGCFLFAFDFMHFTQTRLATIDVYITFFVILMYYFMYRYTRLSFYDAPLRKTFLPLGACGVCMGLGIACKWTGVYAGAGLALIFFGVMYRRYREYLYARKNPRGSTEGISHAAVLERFVPDMLRTFRFCLLFFVAVPLLIYLLSYLPFRDGTTDGTFLRLLHNQEYMFRYHSSLDSSHPYSSPWYQWPVMQRPIWYYSRIVTGSSGAGGLREGISAFGNPLVWWAGIPAALYTLYRALQSGRARRKLSSPAAHCPQEKSGGRITDPAPFLLVGYLAQYLPWCFITRVTFIYHYFPSVVFVVLMLVFCLSKLQQKCKKKGFTALLLLYGAGAFSLFLLFYPVLSGQPVEAEFVNRFLRWFGSWVLAAR